MKALAFSLAVVLVGCSSGILVMPKDPTELVAYCQDRAIEAHATCVDGDCMSLAERVYDACIAEGTAAGR